MSALVIIFLIVLAVVGIGIWITVGLFGLMISLFIAGFVGWLADRIVPGKLPYGWLGAIAAGLLGNWLGSAIFGDFGPSIAGIALIPALIGAIALAFVAEALQLGARNKR